MQVNGNFLVQIELMPPPKAEALAHLDGDGPAPKRYARVTVIRGGHNDCMDYQVGRGPVNAASLHTTNTSCEQCAYIVLMASSCNGVMVSQRPHRRRPRPQQDHAQGRIACFLAPSHSAC